ncbi:MAG: hypothetical protein EHM13_05850, partial [Acidobacteria bacterium]
MRRLLRQNLSLRTFLLVSCEGVLIVLAVIVATWLRLGTDAARTTLFTAYGLAKALLIAFVCQVCFYYADLYDSRVTRDRRELFIRSMQAFGFAAVILAGLYYWLPVLIIGGDGVTIAGRGVLVYATGMVLLFTVGWRLVFEWGTRHVRARERLLLVGTGAAAVDLARELYERRAELGVEIVGFVDPDPVKVGEPLINPGIVGTIDDIPAIAAASNVDRVVVSLADARGKLPMEHLLDMRLNGGIRFDHLASVYEEYTGKIALENLRPSWLIFSSGFEKTRVLIATKRAMDLAAASVGFLVFLPLMLLVGLAVKLTSPGAVIFRQKRVGQHGRVFEVFK